MSKLIINGPTRLVGEVDISGAKNAAVGIIPATLLINGKCKIDNVPDISDINMFLDILKELGSKITHLDKHCLIIDNTKIHTHIASDELSRQFRASYYLLGSLLGRFGKAQVSLPGGCNLGARPIDQHEKCFRKLGAKTNTLGGKIYASVDKLKGANIYLDIVSVGATINGILAATLAEGVTIIENAAKEPHIVDVANFLNTMGANIKGAGTDIIKITGVKSLKSDGEYSIVPDQIEAGTFMMAAAASRGDITLRNCTPKHLECISNKLIDMGVNVEEGDDWVRVWCDGNINSVNVKTLPYPGFPTDMQPQTAVALSTATGVSTLIESIWDSRFQYTEELIKMGANITVHDKTAIITGVPKLTASVIYSHDLRAGAAMIIAGCVAEGKTEILDIHYIDRGYEKIEEKFKKLGADITRLN